MKIKRLIINKLAGLIILLASSAIPFNCNLVFHETELPESLRNKHRF